MSTMIGVNLIRSDQSTIHVIYINPDITYSELFDRVSTFLGHAGFSLSFPEMMPTGDDPTNGSSPLPVMLTTDEELQVFLALSDRYNNILQLNVTATANAPPKKTCESVDCETKVFAGDRTSKLLMAAQSGDIVEVRNLLQQGVPANAANTNGLNALHMASKEGHQLVVRILLERSAGVDAATKRGHTALHIACLAGHKEIVKTLIAWNAAVNVRSSIGLTPLYMAAQNNHVTIVKQLLEHHADPSITADGGFSPFDVALQQAHPKVVALLSRHSSPRNKDRTL